MYRLIFLLLTVAICSSCSNDTAEPLEVNSPEVNYNLAAKTFVECCTECVDDIQECYDNNGDCNDSYACISAGSGKTLIYEATLLEKPFAVSVNKQTGQYFYAHGGPWVEYEPKGIEVEDAEQKSIGYTVCAGVIEGGGTFNVSCNLPFGTCQGVVTTPEGTTTYPFGFGPGALVLAETFCLLLRANQ